MIWLYLLIHCIILGLFGRYVALQKNRSPSEGFLFGFFLSVVGIIIIALLPNKDNPKKLTDSKKILTGIGYLFLIIGVVGVIALVETLQFSSLNNFYNSLKENALPTLLIIWICVGGYHLINNNKSVE